MSDYSGLKLESILQNNLEVPNYFFWKDLLRNEGKTLGRLDSSILELIEKKLVHVLIIVLN